MIHKENYFNYCNTYRTTWLIHRLPRPLLLVLQTLAWGSPTKRFTNTNNDLKHIWDVKLDHVVKGGDVLTARVGDPLALRFQIEDRWDKPCLRSLLGKHLHLLLLQIDRCHRVLTIRGSPYQIFVRELVAMDGSDASEILLIDSIGDHCSDNIHNFKFRAKMSGLKFFYSQAAQQTPVSCRG